MKAAFASDVGLENDALQVNDGYVWYDVREVIPSAVKTAGRRQRAGECGLGSDEAAHLAADKAKAIVEKAGNTTKLETIATELAVQLKTVTGFKRNVTRKNLMARQRLPCSASGKGSDLGA